MTDNSAEQVVGEVESLEALDSIAFYAATVKRGMNTIEAERDTQLATIQESYKERLDPLRIKYDTLIETIFSYMIDHQAELFVDKKSKELLHATLKITDTDELVVRDEEAVILLLKTLQRTDAIRAIESIKKEIIKDDAQLIAQIPDLSIGRNRTYNVILKPKPSDGKSNDPPIKESRKVSLD